jgi:nitrite reductase (NADH) small subunit/3-phenylpropionate/trans-cinnamate dioxygenase ferredoxin subunit
MSESVRVGRIEDFREGRPRRLKVAGRWVAVFRVGDVLHAVQDPCPHMGASLSEGRLIGHEIVCHWHGWKFDLASGAGRAPAKRWACLRVYGVEVEQGQVRLRPPPEPEPSEESWAVWNDREFLRRERSDRLADGDVGPGEADGDTDTED